MKGKLIANWRTNEKKNKNMSEKGTQKENPFIMWGYVIFMITFHLTLYILVLAPSHCTNIIITSIYVCMDVCMYVSSTHNHTLSVCAHVCERIYCLKLGCFFFCVLCVRVWINERRQTIFNFVWIYMYVCTQKTKAHIFWFLSFFIYFWDLIMMSFSFLCTNL